MRTLQKQNTAERVANGLNHEVELRLVKLLNIFLITFCFACCWFLYYSHQVILSPSPFRSGGIITMFILLYCTFCRIYDAFLISLKRISELFFSQLLSILFADAFMLITLWLISGDFPNLLHTLSVMVGQLFFSLMWCRYAHVWYFSRFVGQKTAIVFDEQTFLKHNSMEMKLPARSLYLGLVLIGF